MSLVDRDGSEKAPVLLKSVTFYASAVTPLPATMHVINISTLLCCKQRLPGHNRSVFLKCSKPWWGGDWPMLVLDNRWLDIFEEGLLYDFSESVFHLLTECSVPFYQSFPPLHPLILIHPSFLLQDGRQFLPVPEEDEGCARSFQQTQWRAGPCDTGTRVLNILNDGDGAISTRLEDAVALCVDPYRTECQITLGQSRLVAAQTVHCLLRKPPKDRLRDRTDVNSLKPLWKIC